MKNYVIKDIFTSDKIEIKKYQIPLENIGKFLKITLDSENYEHFFLVIKDPKKNVRALLTYKTNIHEYIIAEEESYSSYCTTSGKLLNGEWDFIIIKPYEIKGGFSINIEKVDIAEKNNLKRIEFDPEKIYSESSAWYKGDFHMHSTYSDGNQNLKEMDAKATEKKLDFMALTDHSIVSTHFYETDRIIIPSTEITFDDKGHFNVFGVTELIDYTKFFKEIEYQDKYQIINEIMDFFKKQGCFLSLNHSFHKIISFKHNINFENVDFIEILNAPHEPKEIDHNIKAIEFLDFLWNKNFLLYGIGGSDSHHDLDENKYSLGDPLSYFYLKELSFKSLMESAKKGNSYVTRDGELNLSIQSKEKEILPGEKIVGEVDYSVIYTKPVKWVLIKNGKEISSVIADRVNYKFEVKSEDFYRVMAFSEDGLRVEVFINSIHCKEERRYPVTWNELLSEFENNYGSVPILV
ncbi:MAG: CehA/McbA family metallohydrolase [Fusobacteriaceae bacterium]